MLTNRSKVVVKKEMNFLEKIYLPAVFGGVIITIKHLFRRKATVDFLKSKDTSARYGAVNTF